MVRALHLALALASPCVVAEVPSCQQADESSSCQQADETSLLQARLVKHSHVQSLQVSKEDQAENEDDGAAGWTVDGCDTKNYFDGEHPLTFHSDSHHTADVRCCSDDGETCQSDGFEGGVDFHNNHGRINTGCVFGATHDEAVGHCAAAGKRLCYTSEVETCCGGGCNHNHHAIWVLPAAWTIDGCATRNYVDGEHPLTFQSDPQHTADVRCCSYDGETCQSEGFEGGVDFHNNKGRITPGCVFGATHFEAVGHCAAAGKRLCHISEVPTCCGDGCNHNHHAIWVLQDVDQH